MNNEKRGYTEGKLIMLCGLPGSGKSTYAKKMVRECPDAVIFSSDELRDELFGSRSTTSAQNKKLFRTLQERIKDSLRKGQTAIYDATNIYSDRRKAFLAELEGIDCEKHCIIIGTPYDVCLKQNRSRKHSVPAGVIKHMAMDWEIPETSEGWDTIKKLTA